MLAGTALGLAPSAHAAASTEKAAATVVCWKRLLNDWYDGRIDHAYPVRCYNQAIANLPEDVQVYADAESDIRRALLAAIRSTTKTTGKTPSGSTPVKPPPKPTPVAATTTKTTKTTAKAPTTKTQTETGAAVVPLEATPIEPTSAAPETPAIGASRSADSLPVPLLVLGALAMLLLAAGGAGMVAKRVQARRVPAAPTTTDEPPAVS